MYTGEHCPNLPYKVSRVSKNIKGQPDVETGGSAIDSTCLMDCDKFADA